MDLHDVQAQLDALQSTNGVMGTGQDLFTGQRAGEKKKGGGRRKRQGVKEGEIG